jgi:hypothetical protein
LGATLVMANAGRSPYFRWAYSGKYVSAGVYRRSSVMPRTLRNCLVKSSTSGLQYCGIFGSPRKSTVPPSGLTALTTSRWTSYSRLE